MAAVVDRYGIKVVLAVGELMMKYRKWTYAEIKRIDDLRHQGFTRKQIADEMGVNVWRVNNICCKYLSRITRPWTTGEDAIIRRMTEEGKTAREISEVLRCDVQTIFARQHLMRKRKK